MNSFLPINSPECARVAERTGVTFDILQNEILPAGRPVLMRGLVSDWPLVRFGRESPRAFCDYIRQFDRGNAVPTMFGPAAIQGRFFYNADLSGFNFSSSQSKLATVLDYILRYLDDPLPGAMAAQSIPVGANLTGLSLENQMPLLDPDVDPRIWIGNRVVVAAHHDPSENIACVVAGRRRFTVMPPDQVANLYPGPFELTPAGASISMIDFDNPDLQAYPRFAEAMANAQVADMEPGDALYIPYHWWHHVRSLDRFNALVNYWWAAPHEGRGAPRDAFFHAMLAIKELPPSHRQAWRAMFDHYVFQDNGDPGGHLPAERRGIIGRMNKEAVRSVRALIARTLQQRS